MRIELLGPSGVGKSAVLAAAESLRVPEATWLGPAEADARLRPGRTPTSRRQLARDAVDDFAPREFVDRCIAIVVSSAMRPSQKLSALGMLRTVLQTALELEQLESDELLVHDELLLHRAFTLLLYAQDFEADVAWYFGAVPVPDAALIVHTHADVIVARSLGRETLPNCYYDLDEPGLREVVDRSLVLCEIAAETLAGRGVMVERLDAGGPVAETSPRLRDLILRTAGAVDLRARLLDASRSFRKKNDRHELRTKDVFYCAFRTPRFTIARADAQRDAASRIARFGLTPTDVRGRRVLDLGSNAGAMLFELSNHGLKTGLGIEYDQDKVDLSREIAALSGLASLTFAQGDIDQLDPTTLGTFDIVLALAIEAHVLDAPRLYWLLGEVTRGALYFEGNGNADVDAVRASLMAAGFAGVDYLGFCDDDIVPANNKRPMLVARKG